MIPYLVYCVIMGLICSSDLIVKGVLVSHKCVLLKSRMVALSLGPVPRITNRKFTFIIARYCHIRKRCRCERYEWEDKEGALRLLEPIDTRIALMRKAIHRYTLLTLLAFSTTPSRRRFVPHAMSGASAQTCRPLLGGAAGVSSISNACLLMITQCLRVTKLEMFARDQMQLHACL